MESNIDTRAGWPDELKVVLRDYPRDTWGQTHSSMARFWIDKHNYLRRQSVALQDANDDYRKDPSKAAHFGSWVAPRLQGFLGELHGHHQIEDFHYFPSFKQAEPRLCAGFDVLNSDHQLIHTGIMGIVESINEFIKTIQTDSANNLDAQKRAADSYVEASAQLHARLLRHLEDEEDLIIPLMIRQDA